jgi:hypothetical protein
LQIGFDASLASSSAVTLTVPAFASPIKRAKNPLIVVFFLLFLRTWGGRGWRKGEEK